MGKDGIKTGIAVSDTPQRIGIMGGSFDPIHIGHLVTAQEALERFELDTVIFMVAGGMHPTKDRLAASPKYRLAMTEIATRSNEHFEVSDWEVQRGEGGEVTYTVDTLRYLRTQYSQGASDNTEFFFITGSDAVFEILEWKDSAELANLATFIGATRPGYDIAHAKQAHAAALQKFDVRYLEVPALAVSSTDIRARVCAGRSIRYLVGDEVADYLYEHSLYREEQH